MKNIFKIILSLALAASLAACGDDSKDGATTATGTPKSSAKEDAALLDNARVTKLNLYINFSNRARSDVSKTLERYIDDFGQEEQVLGKRSPKAKVPSFWSSNPSFDKDLEATITAKPAIEGLDAAMGKILPLSKELATLLNSAADYYKAQDYRDDNFDKGQALHAKIIALAPQYKEAHKVFDAALTAENKKSSAAEMASAQKKGWTITYNRLAILTDIENIFEELERQGVDSGNFVQKADLAALKPFIDSFNEHQKNLREVAENEEQKKKEGFTAPGRSIGYSSFVSKSTDFKVSLLEFVDRVENKKPFSNSDLRRNGITSAKGTMNNLIYLNNEMVNNYNR